MSSFLFPAKLRIGRTFLAACFLVVSLPPRSIDAVQVASSDASPQSQIAATVDGTTISTDQVERDLARTTQGIQLNPTQQAEARARTLDKLINQRIAFEFLKKHNAAVGDEEVRLQVEELKTKLATVEKTIDDYLQQSTQTLDELHFQTAWQISWERYLERKLTDEFLESHFNQNKRQFDGTKLRVAHLLLKHPTDPTPQQTAALAQQAKHIVDQIASGSLTWEQAVAEQSQAPTRTSGGVIGWIRNDGPMPQSFTRAAFELSPGQVSGPVTTDFGIHIIKCLEVKEGKLGWRDIIDEVKKSASRAYFDAIVEKHRPEVTIKR